MGQPLDGCPASPRSAPPRSRCADEGTRDEIMAIIERQWRERGLTVVIVTHDSWVAGRAERRLLLQQGQVRELPSRP
jgi:predicted ABC-type transport system involved in lysophospholipase L1 biosynthesis ATPase subunit